MKYVIVVWAAPLVLFWGWFFLSFNDINFGSVYFTRALHDLVFKLYGEMLGVDPASIPAMIADACIFDATLLLAIWALRRRKELVVWLRDRYQRYLGTAPTLEPEFQLEPGEPRA